MAETNRLRLRSEYMARLLREATQLNRYSIGRQWFETGVPVEDAIAWANLGYLPEDAAPLIAHGVTPTIAEAADDAAVAADGGPDAHLRAAVLRAVEDHNLIVDPDLADRLGLD